MRPVLVLLHDQAARHGQPGIVRLHHRCRHGLLQRDPLRRRARFSAIRARSSASRAMRERILPDRLRKPPSSRACRCQAIFRTGTGDSQCGFPRRTIPRGVAAAAGRSSSPARRSPPRCSSWSITHLWVLRASTHMRARFRLLSRSSSGGFGASRGLSAYRWYAVASRPRSPVNAVSTGDRRAACQVLHAGGMARRWRRCGRGLATGARERTPDDVCRQVVVAARMRIRHPQRVPLGGPARCLVIGANLRPC